jgi:hypothetical protein
MNLSHTDYHQYINAHFGLLYFCYTDMYPEDEMTFEQFIQVPMEVLVTSRNFFILITHNS